MQKIISIALDNFKNDSRVLKECISLQKDKMMFKVIALYDEGQKEFEEIQKIPVYSIKLKSKHWLKRQIAQQKLNGIISIPITNKLK